MMASNMQSGEQQLMLSLVAYILVFVDKKGCMVFTALGVHSRVLQPSVIPMLNNRKPLSLEKNS